MNHYYFILYVVLVHKIIGTNNQPLGSIAGIKSELLSDRSAPDSDEMAKILGCKTQKVDDKSAKILPNGNLFLKNSNQTYHLSNYIKHNDDIHICINGSEQSRNSNILNCKKWMYDEDEYTVLPNRSVLAYGQIWKPGEFEFQGQKLVTCITDNNPGDSVTGELPPSEQDIAAIYIGKIGSSISIFALSLHLLTFCMVPSLRNLPGCNLASLSVAFLFGYSFLLIGQIPEVLGVFCVISGVLQQNFFLAAFFCMNVMAFDVWRTLKLATEKLIVSSKNIRKRQFMWYSLYAWGIPMLITILSVVIDNIAKVPDRFKPQFGKDETCWMTNNLAKAIFFAVPAFTLFVINAIFFLRSAFIIKSNITKCPNEQQKQSMKMNYILYVRLALMMGITWLVGVIAIISDHYVIWLINDILNSLQGLFVFLLFTCSKKVIKHLKEKATSVSSKMNSSQKHCSSSSKATSQMT